MSAAQDKLATWPKHMRPEDAGQLPYLRKPQSAISLGLRFNVACIVAAIALALAVSIYSAPLSYFSRISLGEDATALADVFEVRDIDDGLPANLRPGFQNLRFDGEPLSSSAARDLATSDVGFTAHVGEQFQYQQGMPSGCEIVSLSIALESMGHSVSARDLANQFLVREDSFAAGYQGSPYGVGTGFPAAIGMTANAYLESVASEFSAHNLTGSPFASVRALVESGYPVLVWTTVHLQEPLKSGVEEAGLAWYDNAHCVVVYGFGEGSVLVSDPIDGLIARDEAEFANIYNECGSMALAIC